MYNLDSLAHNQDWTKVGTWDLPTTKLEFLAWALRSDIDLEHFKTTIAYKAHVNDPELEWLKEI